MRRGVLLYGPPAAGKDTITAELVKLSPRYRHFRRLKAGPGRTASYRVATLDQLAELDAAGLVIWRNDRYGAAYVIDRPTLTYDAATSVPVVHVGQPEAVEAVRAAVPSVTWLAVFVHCSRQIAAERLAGRGTGDIDARLRAWDETPPLSTADLIIDTGRSGPRSAARLIDRAVSSLET